MAEPVRMTQARAEALLAVFEAGASAVESGIRQHLMFGALATAEEVQVVKARDVQLAQAKDAAAIIRHRYLHGDEPVEAHATLF